MKYAWIAEQAQSFPLSDLCSVLEVSVSGYRAWQRGGGVERKRLSDAQMLAVIRAIHAETRGAYGSPRMLRELRARGIPASKQSPGSGLAIKHKPPDFLITLCLTMCKATIFQ